MRYKKGTFTTVPNKDELRGMPVNAQVVFMWLCAYADEDGICYPSRETLAKDTGLSVKSIDRAIFTLEVRNLVQKTPRKDPKNPLRNLSNYYQIMIPEYVEVAPDVPQGRATGTPGGGAYMAQRTKTILSNQNQGKASPSFEVVKDEKPHPLKGSKSRVALMLREELYDYIEKELGARSTTTMADYTRIVDALKRLTPKQVTWLVEDGIDRGKRTVRECLTARAIDMYLQDN